MGQGVQGCEGDGGMDDAIKRDVPGWYWLVAAAGLLFELAGCAAFLLQMTADPAAQPIDQRALVAAMPAWMVAAYGVAVIAGLVGALALLMRRRWAGGALLVSLVAIVVQFGGIALVPAMRGAMSSSQLLGPILIFLVAYGLWRFAVGSARRGWLRAA